MKRVYSEPTVEKIDFNYREQVVAASGPIATMSGGHHGCGHHHG